MENRIVMTQEEIKKKVSAFLSAKGEIKDVSDNYIEAGVLDSMGIVQMVMAFEQTFGIHFEAEHFQDPKFATVSGLVTLIEQLTNS